MKKNSVCINNNFNFYPSIYQAGNPTCSGSDFAPHTHKHIFHTLSSFRFTYWTIYFQHQRTTRWLGLMICRLRRLRVSMCTRPMQSKSPWRTTCRAWRCFTKRHNIKKAQDRCPQKHILSIRFYIVFCLLLFYAGFVIFL